MEINASYRTCIVGKVAIYYGVRVMLTEIKRSLNDVKMFKTQVDLYCKLQASGFTATFDLMSTVCNSVENQKLLLSTFLQH